MIIFHGPGTQERLSRSDIAWNSSSAFFVGTGVGGAPATTSDLPATVADMQVILNLISNVANVIFINDNINPDIVFATAGNTPGKTVLEADIYLKDSYSSSDFLLDGIAVDVIIHETLHALGISHPKELETGDIPHSGHSDFLI